MRLRNIRIAAIIGCCLGAVVVSGDVSAQSRRGRIARASFQTGYGTVYKVPDDITVGSSREGFTRLISGPKSLYIVNINGTIQRASLNGEFENLALPAIAVVSVLEGAVDTGDNLYALAHIGGYTRVPELAGSMLKILRRSDSGTWSEIDPPEGQNFYSNIYIWLSSVVSSLVVPIMFLTKSIISW